jgi:hypothetical protein
MVEPRDALELLAQRHELALELRLLGRVALPGVVFERRAQGRLID